MSAACHRAPYGSGLYGGHAYTILGV